MKSLSFSHNDLVRLHEAAISSGLAESRRALLVGLPAAFVATLPVAASPTEQVLMDLGALNQAGHLTESIEPMATWLQNAAALTATLDDATFFKDALSRLSSDHTTAKPPRPRIEHPYPLDRHFVGRQAERIDLTKWFDDTGDNVCVVEAIGGVGKSALAWFWVQYDVIGAFLEGTADPASTPRFAPRSPAQGVFWWSFYEPNARFPEFLRRAEHYARPRGGALALSDSAGRSVVDRLLEHLSGTKLLLVLDGFERELCSYAEGFRGGDGDVPPGGDQREVRQCLDPTAAYFLQAVAARPELRSRILLTSRLLPAELEDRSGALRPGCRQVVLNSFTAQDVIHLFRSHGVSASPVDILALAAKYGSHPLAIRLVLGVILGDPFDKGDLAAASDYDPIPHLVNKQHHILQVAYESLSSLNQELLSGIAAYRGPVDDAGIAVVEKFHMERRGMQVRSRAALKRAVQSLIVRNILLRENRRGVFDLHPIVRKYAYDRLLNKKAVHLALTNYFQAFASDVPIARRSDLEPLVELFHQQLAADQKWSAFQLLHDRIYRPLVQEFCDIRTAYELFTCLASDGRPWKATIGNNDPGNWYNQTYAALLRSSGFATRATSWLKRARSALDFDAGAMFSVQQMVASSVQMELDLILNLRSTGFLTAALDKCEYLRRHSVVVEHAPLGVRSRLSAEHALTLGTLGRTEEATIALSEIRASVFGERVQERRGAHQERLLARARLSHCESLLAFWAGHASEGLRLARAAKAEFASCRQNGIAVQEDELRALAQIAICQATLCNSPGPRNTVQTGSSDMNGKTQLAMLRDQLVEGLRMCHQSGLLEAEIDVQLAVASVELALYRHRAACSHAELGASLAERSGCRLRLADALLLMAQASQEENPIRAVHLLGQAEEAAKCEGGDHCYAPTLHAVCELAIRLAR